MTTPTQIPTKSLKSGFTLPVYGLGLWLMGGRLEKDTSKDAQEIKAIQSAIDLGITHIDTASLYGAGHAESLLGEAIKGYQRDKLFIATKFLRTEKTYEEIMSSSERSLKRIGTDSLDLYLMHFYDYKDDEILGTAKAINKLLADKVIKNFGVCNIIPEIFTKLQSLIDHKIVCIQNHYNVEYRESEDKKIVDFCRETDTMFVAWRPLQYGQIDTDSEFLDKLAKKYNKTPMQICLNWLISQENVATICKTSNVEHLKENLGAIGWSLEKEDIEHIRQNYPNQKMASNTVPLNYYHGS